MSRVTPVIAFLLSAAVGGVGQAHGQAQGSTQDGGATIGRSAKVYSSLSSLRADFVQVLDNPMIDSATTRGTLVQAGADKFAMRFREPPGEAIVMDGKHVWIYTPSTTPGQVIRLAMPSGGPAYGYNILGWLLDRPAERYRAKTLRAERLNGRTTDVIELIPNVRDLPFDRAVIWLDREDALPRRLEIQEKNGATRTLALSKLQVNERIPEKTFQFDPPPKTRIVDQ